MPGLELLSKKGLASPYEMRAPCVHEALGVVLFVTVLLLASALLFWAWIMEYLIPIAELVGAECLILAAGQERGHTLGFAQEPLYRARIQVYLLDSMQPACCCNTTAGDPRCSEWSGVAYDTLTGKFTPKEKPSFMRSFGSVGSFTPCWHSRDKEIIAFVREFNFIFLMAPCVCALAGLWGACKGADKVTIWARGAVRRRQGYKQALADEERGERPSEEEGSVLGKGSKTASQSNVKERPRHAKGERKVSRGSSVTTVSSGHSGLS